MHLTHSPSDDSASNLGKTEVFVGKVKAADGVIPFPFHQVEEGSQGEDRFIPRED